MNKIIVRIEPVQFCCFHNAAEELAADIDIFQVSAGTAPDDLHDEPDRELQPTAQEGHEDPDYLPVR